MAINPALLENLECSICSEFVDDPRLLPCGHMFCGPHKNCITSLRSSDGSVVCPNCRAQHAIDVNGLKPMFALRSFLEGCAKSAQKEYIPHNKAEKKEKRRKCEFHPGQDLKYFCENCMLESCELCWIEEHASHQVVLSEIKFRLPVSKAIANVDFESRLSFYGYMIENNRRRKRFLLTVLAEIDMLNAIFTTQKSALEALHTKCKMFLTQGPVDEETMQELMKELAKISNDDHKKAEDSVKVESSKLFHSFMETFNNHTVSSGFEEDNTKREVTSTSNGFSVEQASPNMSTTSSTLHSIPKVFSVSQAIFHNTTPSGSSFNSIDLFNRHSNGGNFDNVFHNADYHTFELSGTSVKARETTGSCFIRKESEESKIRNTNEGSEVASSEQWNYVKPKERDPVGDVYKVKNQTVIWPKLSPIPSTSHPLPKAPGLNMRDNYETGKVLKEDGIIAYIDGDILNTRWSIAYSIRDFYFTEGFAKKIVSKFTPIPNLCRKRSPRKGGIYYFADHRVDPVRYIYTLVTASEENPYSSYYDLESALNQVLSHALASDIDKICMPTLCTMDGDRLTWDKVVATIKKVFDGQNIRIFVYA